MALSNDTIKSLQNNYQFQYLQMAYNNSKVKGNPAGVSVGEQELLDKLGLILGDGTTVIGFNDREAVPVIQNLKYKISPEAGITGDIPDVTYPTFQEAFQASIQLVVDSVGGEVDESEITIPAMASQIIVDKVFDVSLFDKETGELVLKFEQQTLTLNKYEANLMVVGSIGLGEQVDGRVSIDFSEDGAFDLVDELVREHGAPVFAYSSNSLEIASGGASVRDLDNISMAVCAVPSDYELTEESIKQLITKEIDDVFIYIIQTSNLELEGWMTKTGNNNLFPFLANTGPEVGNLESLKEEDLKPLNNFYSDEMEIDVFIEEDGNSAEAMLAYKGMVLGVLINKVLPTIKSRNVGLSGVGLYVEDGLFPKEEG